jgi:hypothetical protein
MTVLAPTPELLAAARRVASRTWTVGHRGPADLTDPHLKQLVDARLAYLHYTPAFKRTDDYWRLTVEGEQWLAEHEPGA